ncbi:MAG: signal peptidase II [Planctomycetota bacterium]
MKYRLAFFIIALSGAVIDLISKSLVFKTLENKQVSDIIPGVFGFKLVTNEGIIWGLFPGHNILFLAVSILAVPLIIIIFLLQPKIDRWLTVSLGLIMAGTAGNLYDRLAHQAVRDFLDFYLINWPIFNLADAFITIGAIILLFSLFLSKPEQKQSETKRSE